MARLKPSALAICRAAIALVWIYQGLVPKLLGPDKDELAMSMALGVSREMANFLSYSAGLGELALGAAVLLLRRREWPLWLTLASMPLLLVYTAWAMPSLLTAAFNPVSANLAVGALAAVALMLQKDGMHSAG